MEKVHSRTLERSEGKAHWNTYIYDNHRPGRQCLWRYFYRKKGYTTPQACSVLESRIGRKPKKGLNSGSVAIQRLILLLHLQSSGRAFNMLERKRKAKWEWIGGNHPLLWCMVGTVFYGELMFWASLSCCCFQVGPKRLSKQDNGGLKEHVIGVSDRLIVVCISYLRNASRYRYFVAPIIFYCPLSVEQTLPKYCTNCQKLKLAGVWRAQLSYHLWPVLKTKQPYHVCMCVCICLLVNGISASVHF